MLEVSILYGAKPHKKNKYDLILSTEAEKTLYAKREMERVW